MWSEEKNKNKIKNKFDTSHKKIKNEIQVPGFVTRYGYPTFCQTRYHNQQNRFPKSGILTQVISGSSIAKD